MGYYAEKGKEFELFQGQYRIKLLFGDKLSYGEGDLKPFQITYFCKSHEKIYRIRKSEDKFICGEYELDETDIDDIDDIIGIGAGLEITAEDLDLMFGDWEEFSKKLKPVTEENIDWLVKEVPQLNEPIILEDIFKVGGGVSYGSLKNQLDALHTADPSKVKNALGALIKNLELEKDSQNEDSTKLQVERIIDGKKKKTKEYTKVIKRGEIWRVQFTRGVGHELQSERPALVISTDKRNATLGTIMCLGIEGHEVIFEESQVGIEKEDVVYIGTDEIDRESRVELTVCCTLDRARFLKKYGDLNPDKMQEVLEKFKKYYELPNDSVKQEEVESEEPAPENEEVADSESVESGEEVADSENVEGKEE